MGKKIIIKGVVVYALNCQESERMQSWEAPKKSEREKSAPSEAWHGWWTRQHYKEPKTRSGDKHA